MDLVCLGELLVDLVALGPDDSIESATTFRKAAGGAPANVAVGVARLGVSVGFIGKLGNDAFGRFLRTTMVTNGVDVRNLVTDPAAKTPLAFVGSEAEGGRSFIFYHRGLADTILRPEELDGELIGHASIFHFGSVSLAAEPGRSATFAAGRIARDRGCLVSFDPNVRLQLWDSADEARACILEALPLAHVVKVSSDETHLLTGTTEPPEAAAALRSLGPLLAVVTMAGEGCYYQSETSDGYLPAMDVAPVDSTGAGDAFVAGLLVELLSAGGRAAMPIAPVDLVRALRFASAAGALATTGYGAIPSLPSRARVVAYLGDLDAAPAASADLPIAIDPHPFPS